MSKNIHLMSTDNGMSVLSYSFEGNPVTGDEMIQLARSLETFGKALLKIESAQIVERSSRDADWHFTQQGKLIEVRGIGAGVYFVHSERLDAIKIGHSFTPYARIKEQGKTWIGPLTVIAVACLDTPYTFERALHIQFSEYRKDGEWFKSEPVRNWLESLKWTNRHD